MNELGKCGTFTYMANSSAGKDVRPICMHRELSPKISTNDSITSLQASRIMSCGITVSPSGNHLPVHRLQRTRVAVIAPLLHNSRSKVSSGGRSIFLHLIADHLRLSQKENEDGSLTRNILTFPRTLTVVMETEKPQPLSKKGLAK